MLPKRFWQHSDYLLSAQVTGFMRHSLKIFLQSFHTTATPAIIIPTVKTSIICHPHLRKSTLFPFENLKAASMNCKAAFRMGHTLKKSFTTGSRNDSRHYCSSRIRSSIRSCKFAITLWAGFGLPSAYMTSSSALSLCRITLYTTSTS